MASLQHVQWHQRDPLVTDANVDTEDDISGLIHLVDSGPEPQHSHQESDDQSNGRNYSDIEHQPSDLTQYGQAAPILLT